MSRPVWESTQLPSSVSQAHFLTRRRLLTDVRSRGPSSAGSLPNMSGPTSFKTNVNRQKTKRWVEAKTYAYDGDDWGEADDYDEDRALPAPSQPAPSQPGSRPTGLRQRGQSAGVAMSSEMPTQGAGSALANGIPRLPEGTPQTALNDVRPPELPLKDERSMPPNQGKMLPERHEGLAMHPPKPPSIEDSASPFPGAARELPPLEVNTGTTEAHPLPKLKDPLSTLPGSMPQDPQPASNLPNFGGDGQPSALRDNPSMFDIPLRSHSRESSLPALDRSATFPGPEGTASGGPVNAFPPRKDSLTHTTPQTHETLTTSPHPGTERFATSPLDMIVRLRRVAGNERRVIHSSIVRLFDLPISTSGSRRNGFGNDVFRVQRSAVRSRSTVGEQKST